MLNLPIEMIVLMQPFAPVFSERTWDWVKVLVVGAILAPGKRTVTSVLRVVGLSDESQFQRYHRVLNRAVWSSLHISQILLGLLVIAFVPLHGSIIVAADETLERRQGDKIKAKSVFRDAARSSKKHKVTSYGLRWVSMALLVPVPWSQRIWAHSYKIRANIGHGMTTIPIPKQCPQLLAVSHVVSLERRSWSYLKNHVP